MISEVNQLFPLTDWHEAKTQVTEDRSVLFYLHSVSGLAMDNLLSRTFPHQSHILLQLISNLTSNPKDVFTGGGRTRSRDPDEVRY